MVRLIATACLILLSSWVNAFTRAPTSSETCTVKGQSDFSAYFDIYGMWNVQSVSMESANSKEVFNVLSTYAGLTSDMYDTYLYRNWSSLFRRYNALITYDESQQKLAYYRKPTTSDIWGEPIDTSIRDLPSGNIYTTINLDYVSELECEDSLPDLGGQYSSNATYEFGVASCSGGSCEIGFNQEYQITPLVFLMPTIDPDIADNDMAASLSVISVTKTGATILQERAPAVTSGSVEPMTQVSYLVIEPGVADFGGHKVYADYADIDEISRYSSRSTETVYFDNNPEFAGFSSTPVVLGQVQSRNNGDKWITTALHNIGTNSLGAGLELSRSRDTSHTYVAEKIAFLSTEPFTAEVGDFNIQFSRSHTTYDSYNNRSANPIADACDKYATTGLDSIKGVVANKQTRSGTDGGWLRRCEIVGNQVSFVVDEDTTGTNRRHVSETVGYFAFAEKIPELNNLCPYFPQPAQSWKSSSKLELKSPKANSNPYPYHIGGWSQDYIDTHLSGGVLATGFNEVTDNGGQVSCQAGRCAAGGERAETPDNIGTNFNASKTLDLGTWNYAQECSASSSYCRHTIVDNNIEITIINHLKQLKVTGPDSGSYNKIVVNFNAISGAEGLVIEEYETNNNVITRFSQSGNYTFKKVKFNTVTELQTGAEIVWRVKEEVIFSNPVTFYNTGVTDDFVIFGPEAIVQFNSKINNDFYGLILADKVEFKNDITLFGAVTANEFIMDTGNATIVGESECFDPATSEKYILEVTEEYEFALLCENPEFTFSVLNSETGQLVTDYTETIEVTLPAGISVDSVIKGSGSDGRFTADSGQVILSLSSDELGQFEIKGELDNGESDTANLYVAPYIFDADTVYATAAKSSEFNIRVKACKGGDAETVDSYKGDKTIQLSELALSTPSLAQGAFEGDLQIEGSSLGSGASAQVTLNFSSGNASADLTYTESGKLSFLLSDEAAICPDEFDCIDEDGEPWQGLIGTVNVNVRPWTFAICEPDNLTTTGTSSSGSGYKAAGETFSLIVKPIVYLSSETDDPAIRCAADVTRNFFNSDSTAATVYLRAELDTPSTGQIGTGSDLIIKDNSGTVISAGESVLHSNNSNTAQNPWYQFSGLYWNEVGSLQLSADIDDITDSSTNQYLNMTIDTGTRPVGRFYPHHYTLLEEDDTLWDYASGLDDFAYMGQPIKHQFTVQAESSRSDSDGNALITTNYGRFSSGYISVISYKATANITQSDGSDNWQNIESSRLLPSNLEWSSSDWGTNTGQMVIELDSFTLVKNGAVLDGPFSSSNAHFGLVSSRVDNVDFESLDFDAYLTGANSGKQFSTQPDFRYGRMVLTDVGGNQGQYISIPLKVEYWNGTGFTTNNDDSGSQLNASEYCRLPIWSELGVSSNVKLTGTSGDASVNSGKYSGLEAYQTTAAREQFKIWLRQGATEPSGSSIDCESGYVDQPWLKYYWNGATEDEEDPSATVTFGIYRGNDRVIYRGESNFTSQ